MNRPIKTYTWRLPDGVEEAGGLALGYTSLFRLLALVKSTVSIGDL